MRLFVLLCYLVLTLLMVAVILFQKSESGFGLGSGATGGLVSARGASNLLTRITGILATLFMILSLVLTLLSRREVEAQKLLTRDAKAAMYTEKETSSSAVNNVTTSIKKNDKPAEKGPLKNNAVATRTQKSAASSNTPA